METKKILNLSENNKLFVISGNFLGDVKEDIKLIKERYVSKGFEDFDYTEIYIDEIDEQEIYNKILTPPFVSEKKIIVIKDGLKISKKLAEEIENLLEDTVLKTLLIILCIDEESFTPYEIKKNVEQKFKKALHFYSEADPKYLKNITFQRIKNYALEREMFLDDNVIKQLIDFTDGNIYSIYNMINMSYMEGNPLKLQNAENLKNNVEFYDAYIFDFLKSFSDRDLEGTLNSYRKCLEWKIITNDGLVLLLLKQISEQREDYKNRFKNWDQMMLKKSFETLYNLLKDIRKYNTRFAKILVEESIIRIIKGE